MEYVKVADLKSARDADNAAADALVNRGLIEYVAMMADVELPEEDEEEAQHE